MDVKVIAQIEASCCHHHRLPQYTRLAKVSGNRTLNHVNFFALGRIFHAVFFYLFTVG